MKTSTLKKIIFSSITCLLLIVIWEILAIIKDEPMLFPHLTDIAKTLFNLLNLETFKIILVTLGRIIISVVISSVIALIVGMLYIWKKESYAFFSPIVTAMRSIPFIIISIFLVILFDDTISPLIITTLVILPISIQGIITAVDNIDQVLKEDLKMMPISALKSMFIVYIPLIKEYILMVFIQSFGLGVKVMIMGEFFAYSKIGIGRTLASIKSGYVMDELIAWGILIVIMVGIVEIATQYLVRRQNKKINKNKEAK